MKKTVVFHRRLILLLSLALLAAGSIIFAGHFVIFDQWCQLLVKERVAFALQQLDPLVRNPRAFADARPKAPPPSRNIRAVSKSVSKILVRVPGLQTFGWLSAENEIFYSWKRDPSRGIRLPALRDLVIRTEPWQGNFYYLRWKPELVLGYGLYRPYPKQFNKTGRLTMRFDLTREFVMFTLSFFSLLMLTGGLLVVVLGYWIRRYAYKLETAVASFEDNLKEIFLGKYETLFEAKEFTLTQRMANVMNQMFYFFNQDLQKRESEFQRDTLTKLFSRRTLMEKMEQEIQRAKRYAHPFSFIMIDIDHFKKFNDTHGHLMGDKVLADTAAILLENTRETDIVGRYGGEEIAVVLAETPLKEAVKVAEKLRRGVAEHAYAFNNQTVQVTISLGVTSFLGGDEDSVRSMVQRADEALYEAKQAGRNQVRRKI